MVGAHRGGEKMNRIMTDDEKEQYIRKHWFSEHKAKLEKHGDLEVLTWAREDSGTYHCRYIFDGRKMYISGDIGEAVFWLTWRASLPSFQDIHIDYFEEKLQAYNEDRRNYNGVLAVKKLKEWKLDMLEDECEIGDHEAEIIDELINGAECCSSKAEWAYEYVNDSYYNRVISDLECDYWEWMYDIGDEIPLRVYGYLVGLKMAYEQLKEYEEVEEQNVPR